MAKLTFLLSVIIAAMCLTGCGASESSQNTVEISGTANVRYVAHYDNATDKQLENFKKMDRQDKNLKVTIQGHSIDAVKTSPAEQGMITVNGKPVKVSSNGSYTAHVKKGKVKVIFKIGGKLLDSKELTVNKNTSNVDLHKDIAFKNFINKM